MLSFEDELEVVKSVYCHDGEFHQKVPNDGLLKGFTLNLNETCMDCDPGPKTQLQFNLYFPDNYPENGPRVDVSIPTLTTENSKKLNEDLKRFVKSSGLLNNEMMLEVISWVRDNTLNYAAIMKETKPTSDSAYQICAMRVDHMRAKNNYLKSLQKWTEQLCLSTSIIFYKRFIFIIVEGFEGAIEEIIKRLRNRKIDVDSSGHACKERMMTILSRGPSSSENAVNEFHVHQVYLLVELENLFTSPAAKELYLSVLKPIVL